MFGYQGNLFGYRGKKPFGYQENLYGYQGTKPFGSQGDLFGYQGMKLFGYRSIFPSITEQQFCLVIEFTSITDLHLSKCFCNKFYIDMFLLCSIHNAIRIINKQVSFIQLSPRSCDCFT